MQSESKPNEVTAAETSVQFPPLSLMRVRAFLFEQGMAIIPWATAAEVLEDFHELLRSHKANDAFWQSLHELLLALNIDLRRLQPKHAHDAVLHPAAEQALLAEIRARIDVEQTPSNGFLSLSRKLTQACLPVFLLLAGAATVSCGARTDEASTNTDTGGTGAALAQTGGAGFVIPPMGGQMGTGGTNATIPVCATSDGGAMAALSPADVRTIAQKCITDATTRDDVLACLSTLNSSWQTGMESLLNCRNCNDAANYLVALTQSCSSLGDSYVRCLIDMSGCYVYMGVRMS